VEIKVCGPGCANCLKAEKIVNEALAEAGVKASVTKVTGFAEMAALGVLSTPAIVIDGVIKCVGRAPTLKDVLAWIQ